MIKIALGFFGVASLGFFSACGGNNGSGIPVSSTVVSDVSLQGTWKTDCVADKSHEYSAYLSLKFQGNQVVGTIKDFGDKKCQSPAGQSWELSGAYVLGEAVASPVGARQIDYLITRVLTSIDDAAFVKEANDRHYCGLGDWKIGELKDVSATECNNDMWIAQAKFSIIRVEGDQLFVGGNLESKQSGTTAQFRQEALMTEPLIRTRGI